MEEKTFDELHEIYYGSQDDYLENKMKDECDKDNILMQFPKGTYIRTETMKRDPKHKNLTFLISPESGHLVYRNFKASVSVKDIPNLKYVRSYVGGITYSLITFYKELFDFHYHDDPYKIPIEEINNLEYHPIYVVFDSVENFDVEITYDVYDTSGFFSERYCILFDTYDILYETKYYFNHPVKQVFRTLSDKKDFTMTFDNKYILKLKDPVIYGGVMAYDFPKTINFSRIDNVTTDVDDGLGVTNTQIYVSTGGMGGTKYSK